LKLNFGSFQPFLVLSLISFRCVVWSQGGWEIDESMEQAALRETVEEAGVIGSVEVSVCVKALFRLSFSSPPK